MIVLALGLHFAYLAYLVFGGFLTWRWPHAVWPHLAAVGWGIAVITVPLNCPLTAMENWARHRAGQGPLPNGFVDEYLTGVVYPARYLVEVRVLVAALVLISYLGGYARWRARHARGADPVRTSR